MNKIYQEIIHSLNIRGDYTLSWFANCIFSKNTDSYDHAKELAQSCITMGYYAYCEMRDKKPYAIHITKNPINKKNYESL